MANRIDNNDDFNKRNAFKSCSICKKSLGSSGDKAYCSDCTSNNRHANKQFWQKHFATLSLNTLDKKTAELAKNNTLGLHNKISSQKENISYRNINVTSSNTSEVDLSLVKAQVLGYLPNILAELGLSNKVDANLLLDVIVPNQINRPISDILRAKHILKDIVRTASYSLIKDNMLSLDNKFKTYGKNKKVDASALLNEGVIRCGTESELVRNIQAEKDKEDSTFGMENADDVDDEQLEHKEEVKASKKEIEDKDGSVEHLDDDKFQDIFDDKMNPVASIFNNTIHRHNTVETYKTRSIPKPQIAAKSNMEVFAYAHKGFKLPVEAVRTDESYRRLIAQYQPVYQFAANYKDGKKFTWDAHKTDAGYLLLSENSAFHAKSLVDFRNFVASDNTFANWAHLPVEASATVVIEFNDDDEELNDLAEQILPFLSEFMENYDEDEADNIAFETANFVKNTTASDLGAAVLSHIGRKIGNHLDASPLHPKIKSAVKPYLGVSHNKEHGNAVFHDIKKTLSPLASATVPDEKQQKIAQIVEQLKVATDEDCQINLLASFYEATPHFDDDQKKEWLPKVYHSLHDSIKDTSNEAGKERQEFEHNEDLRMKMTPTMEVIEITSGLTVDKFEESLEVLAEMGYSEETILEAAEKLFTKVASEDGADCFSPASYSGLQNAKPEGEQHLKEDEVDSIVPKEATASCEDFSDKDERQVKHIKDSEEKEGKSPEESESIGIATVKKEKNEDK